MIRLSVLLSVLILSAPAMAKGSPQAACRESHQDCREECTLDHGTSVKTRQKLGLCVQRCASTEKKCITAVYERLRKEDTEEKRRAAAIAGGKDPDAVPSDSSRPAPKDPNIRFESAEEQTRAEMERTEEPVADSPPAPPRDRVRERAEERLEDPEPPRRRDPPRGEQEKEKVVESKPVESTPPPPSADPPSSDSSEEEEVRNVQAAPPPTRPAPPPEPKKEPKKDISVWDPDALE